MTRTVQITRPSLITGKPFTRTVYIVREWDTYTGTEQGRPVVVTNTPDGPEVYEVLSDREAHSIVTTQPEPRTFVIVRDWDVTEAHNAPDAHTYGQCQAAAILAACMGSRVAFTEVDGTHWRMERQYAQTDPTAAVWLAMDVTAVRQFDLMGG